MRSKRTAYFKFGFVILFPLALAFYLKKWTSWRFDSDLDASSATHYTTTRLLEEIMPNGTHLRYLFTTLLAATAPLLGFSAAVKDNLVVDLGYAQYRGVALENGITQWLGMRFAAPPLGDLRFRAPADPLTEDGIKDAFTHGPVCLATGAAFPTSGQSEDCLFLDVQIPSSASPDSKLPVYIYIQGGGLNEDSNPNFNASSLIPAADNDLVVVTFNYRVGPYGFLAGKEVQANGDLNVGHLDQRKVFEWVHEHIAKFGGDPGHVVLGGASAGAQSVALHLIAFGETTTDLFHGVIAESQSFPTLFTVSQAQFIYDALAERVGCSGEEDSLACLRGLDISVLQGNNSNMPLPGRSNPPNFLYGSILDGKFLVDIPFKLFSEGKFIKVPSVFGDDTNEGTVFTPTGLNSFSDMDNFLIDNFINISSDALSTINGLYPQSIQPANHGAFFWNAALAYGELRYNCPGIFLSTVINNFSNPTQNFNYHYNVTDPEEVAEGLGVPHTIELAAVWGLANGGPASYSTPLNAPIIPVVQGYWTSFIRSLDPNTHRAEGSPEWLPWGADNSAGKRILLMTNATRVEEVPEDQQTRCNFLHGLGIGLQQ